MTALKIYFVPPGMLADAWSLAERDLRRITVKMRAPWTTDDVKRALDDGTATLHVGFRNGEPAGSMVLEVLNDDTGRRLNIWTLAGAAAREGFSDVIEYLEGWAEQFGCDRIEFRSPFRGWMRLAAPHFAVKEIVFERTVANG